MNFPKFLRQSSVMLKLFPALVVLALVTALGIALVCAVPALAQSVDRSYDSAEARQLYKAARDDYKQGYLKGATHTLEDLIKHFPYSRHATFARRDLRILYARIKRRRKAKLARDRRASAVARKRQVGDTVKRRAKSRAITVGPSEGSSAFERKFAISKDNKRDKAIVIPAPVPVPRYRPKRPLKKAKQRRPRAKVAITIARPLKARKRPDLAGRSGMSGRSALGGISAAKRNEAFKEATVDRVFFGEMDFRLGGKAVTVVAAQADWLKQHPELVITINGHADETGSGKLNRGIARQRAQAVRELLLSEGVEAKRIRIVVHGREKRVAICDSPSCVAQNRRVIIDVLSSGH